VPSSGAHDVALHSEEIGEDFADEFLVVDDEDAGPIFGGHRDSA